MFIHSLLRKVRTENVRALRSDSCGHLPIVGTSSLIKKAFLATFTVSSACILAVISPSAANAALIGVSTIEIKSTFPPVELQVSEVVATETGTGNNLALLSAGATATSLSNYYLSSPDFAIDGIAPAGYPNIFHSGDIGIDQYLRITLAAPSTLDAITIFGRADCCAYRDIYNIEFFDVNGSSLFTATGLSADNPENSVTVVLPNSVAVPTPALLPGLIGIGVAAIRKRKQNTERVA